MASHFVAALVVALPGIALAWLLLRRQPAAIFWFATALIIVGSGYLAATGTADDIYRAVFVKGGTAVRGTDPPAAPGPAY